MDHHLKTQYDYTEEELWREQQRDMAEAEYFAHVKELPTATHVTIVDDTATIPF